MSAITNVKAAYRYLTTIQILEGMPEVFSKADYDKAEYKNFKTQSQFHDIWWRGLNLNTLVKNNLVVFSHKQDTGNTYCAIDENYRECCFSQHLDGKNEFYYYWVDSSDAKPEACVGLIHNGQVFTHADYWQLDARPVRPTKDEIFIPFQLPFKSYPVYCNMYKINKEKMNEYKNIALEIIRIEKAS